MGLWLARLMGGPCQYIAPSRFGYLRSPLPASATPEAQADTYAALLDTLNLDTAVIVGLSAGGPSALQFALRHSGRCRGLIMISAASRSVPPLPRLARSLYPFMLKFDFIPWLMYTLSPQMVFRANGISRQLYEKIAPDAEKRRLLDALFQTTFPSSPRRQGMLNDMAHLTTFPVYPIELIQAPTLVIHAVNDPIIPFASGKFSAAIPRACFLKLAEGGHFAVVTHREETLPALQEFLERSSPAA